MDNILTNAIADSMANRILAIILINKLGGEVVIDKEETAKAIDIYTNDLIQEEHGENDTLKIKILKSEAE